MIWGYIHKNNIAPVIIGEFGSKLETQKDQQWYDALTAYIKNNNLSCTYWSWNPNSGDTGGILADDWKTVNTNKVSKLTSIQLPLDAAASVIASPTNTPTPQATATPTINPTAPTPTKATVTPSAAATASPSVAASKTLSCKVSYSVTQTWNNDGFTAEVKIQNTGNQPVQGWKLAWTFAGNQQVKSLWNGTGGQSGNSVSISNADWNKEIQPNNSVSFGFVGSYSGTNSNPSSFKLNDVQCQ